MIDVIKIHTEITKAIEENKKIRYWINKESEKIYISFNPCFIVVMNLEDFYFNTDVINFEENKVTFELVTTTEKKAANVSKPTFEAVKMEGYIALKFTTKDYNIYLSDKILKLFDKKLENLLILSEGEYKPALIIDKRIGNILGVLAPINTKGRL